MNIQIIEEKSKYCYNFTSQQQLKYFKRDRDKIANSFSSQKFVNILCENFANIYLNIDIWGQLGLASPIKSEVDLALIEEDCWRRHHGEDTVQSIINSNLSKIICSGQ